MSEAIIHYGQLVFFGGVLIVAGFAALAILGAILGAIFAAFDSGPGRNRRRRRQLYA